MTGLFKNAKELRVRTEKDGKYGRMLGWIYADDNELSLNEQMVVDGYAWQYDGGTKREFDTDKWMLDERRKSI